MAVCEEMLARLPTPLSEDVRKLASLGHDNEPRLRLAVQWRCSYKRILLQAVQRSRAALDHLAKQ